MNKTVLCRALSHIKSNLLSENVLSKGPAVQIDRPFSVTHNKNMKLVQFSYKNDPKKIRAGYLEGDGIVDINKADSSLGSTIIEILRNGQIDKVKTCINKMKLVQFLYDDGSNQIHAGYLEGDGVVDINKADTSLGSTVLEILRNEQIEKVKQLKSAKPATVPISTVTVTTPIHGVDKILCIGLNYKDHCEEQKLNAPPVPMIFSKFSSTIIGGDQAVRLRTDVTKKVDWEVELTVVIGKTASFVKSANAFDYVLGYTVAQDISARDWQKEKNMGQFLLGKSMDTFCPLGPCITTSDEIGDPQNLDIKCSVNGVLKQTSNTNQLIHKIPDVIERLSSVMTLLPGDIILTGTPGGVGMYRQPPEYLQPGDVIRNEIQNIGAFEVRVEKF